MRPRFSDLSLRQVLVIAWGPALYVYVALRLLQATGDGPLGLALQGALALATVTGLGLWLRARLARRKLRRTLEE